MPNIAGKCLVSTTWLAEHLTAPDLIVLDGSWHLPTAARDPHREYLAEHIPGAVFFDIDEISDSSNPLPHMLPSTVKFAARMKAMGVGDGMRVVVYDSVGMFSAARVWWTFRTMGHEDVAVLDGGLPKWKAEGRAVEDMTPPARPQSHFTPRLNAELVRDRDDVLSLVKNGGGQILDARAAARFEGSAPEPRAGLRAGHIPDSRNLPYTELLNSDGTLKPAPQLADVLRKAGVDIKRPVVTTCGSGVTASILSLALAIVGQTNSAVYDGSWTEWGADPALPIETGAGR
ncbi:MAG: 3-mercaptopyruvate sulfurtransferase [Hyphomicrobiaceae bacterium]